MANSFEELVYRITGKVVDDSLEITTNVGTTYNFLESPIAHKTNFEVGKNAIKIAPYDAIVEILGMASEDKALNSVTVQDILDFLVLVFEDDVVNLDINKINNRELKVRLLAEPFMVGSQPDSDIVYNVLFYLLTKRTLYVRTFREFRTQLSEPDWKIISSYITTNAVTLAKYFRRNRSLLLFIKKHYSGNKDMRSVINIISKASRKLNVPTSNKTFKDEPLYKKPTSELLKMLYASNVITVRNGLTYEVKGRPKHPYDTTQILSILHERDDIFTDVQEQLKEDGWTLALPSSDKRALGKLPNGSFKELNIGDEIGVRWSGKNVRTTYVDLDLSMVVVDESNVATKFGWDGNKMGAVKYSGDMTHMISESADSDEVSAYESFTINEKLHYATLDLSAYAFGDENTKVELIVGDELIPIQQPTGSMLLGVIINNYFYVYNLGVAGQGYRSLHEASVSSLASFDDIMVDNVWY